MPVTAGYCGWAQSLAQRKRHDSTQLAHLLELRATWSSEDILRAIEHASRYSADAVERILKATAQPRTLEDMLAEGARRQIRHAMATSPIAQRGLAAYARLLSGSDHDPDASQAPDGQEQVQTESGTDTTAPAQAQSTPSSGSDGDS